jgi:hypothetical protein
LLNRCNVAGLVFGQQQRLRQIAIEQGKRVDGFGLIDKPCMPDELVAEGKYFFLALLKTLPDCL